MLETLRELDNLSKTVRASSKCLPWAFTQTRSVGLKNKKSFMEIKPVLVVKHVNI